MKKLFTVFAIAAQFLGMAMGNVGDTADFSNIDRAHFVQGEVSAKDLEGKVVILEYWGTNCGPCVAAMPHLQDLYNKHKDEGLVIIATEIQRSPMDKIKSYLAQNKFTFPVCVNYWLPQAQLQGSMPTTALIGADGKVAFIGKPHQVDAVLATELAKLNGKKSADSPKSDKKAGKKGDKRPSKTKDKKKPKKGKRA